MGTTISNIRLIYKAIYNKIYRKPLITINESNITTTQALVRTNIEKREDNLFTKPYYEIQSHQISIIILIINLLFYLCEILLYTINKHNDFNCTLYNLGAQYKSAIIHDYHLWRLFLPIVLHSCFIHFFMNSLSIFNLGFQLENFIGRTRYIILYIITGIYSNIISVMVNANSLSVGASGSIMGLCGFISLYFICNYWKMIYQERRAIVLFFVMIFLNLVGFSMIINMMQIGRIDNASHFGGYFIGMVLYVLMMKNHDDMLKGKDMIVIISKGTMVLIPFGCFILLYLNKEEIPLNEMSNIC